jgi:BirA family biotin operon repressor/biotin-[acetyl-CoA-carboxylase] ligase
MENKIRIKWLEEADSTNNVLLRHIRDYDNLSVVAAVSQTAGRGQRGNRWVSAPGDNLTFSLLLRPERLPAREVMSLTCLATLAVRDTLRDEGVPAVIKWPNDIYVNQTEFPGEVLNPVSLKRLTGRSYELEPFLEKVCQGIGKLLPELETQESRNGLLEAYEQDLFQKDSPARYRDLATGEEFTGIIRGITSEGLLRVEAEGRERTFGFKEIGYIL